MEKLELKGYTFESLFNHLDSLPISERNDLLDQILVYRDCPLYGMMEELGFDFVASNLLISWITFDNVGRPKGVKRGIATYTRLWRYKTLKYYVRLWELLSSEYKDILLLNILEFEEVFDLLTDYTKDIKDIKDLTWLEVVEVLKLYDSFVSVLNGEAELSLGAGTVRVLVKVIESLLERIYAVDKGMYLFTNQGYGSDVVELLLEVPNNLVNFDNEAINYFQSINAGFLFVRVFKKEYN